MGISRTRLFGLSLLAASTLATTPANALVINLIDTGGVTGTQAELGFKIAARYWESVLTNNATLNFNVSFESLGPGILGGTSSSLRQFVPINTYYSLLNARSSGNTLDSTAVANLSPLSATGSVSAILPAYLANSDGVATSGTRLSPDGQAISNTMAISTANYKALLNNAGFGATSIDGEIAFSSTFAFDFDPTNGISAGTYDFIGVAVHEMGHALGFLSGADDFDYVAGDPDVTDIDDAWWAYAADMFRYSAPGKLDWNYGSDSYFSIDGGATAYRGAYFSTGETNGDGWQASHWKAPGGCTNFEGVMNPYTCGGLRDEVTASDLALFDAIGWNTNQNTGANSTYTFNTAQMYQAFATTPVPEPTTWVMLMLGFGAIGGALRSRRTRTTVQFAA